MVDSKSTVITTSLSENIMHSVGLEPTSTNTLELESSPLDRSGTNAMSPNLAHLGFDPRTFGL
jgi:hypothetical protein